MIDRRKFLAAAPLALVGCASPRMVDGTRLEGRKGILALHVSSNFEGYLGFNPFGESTFGSRFAEGMVGAKGGFWFKPKDQFLLLGADEGEYMWTKLTTGNQYAWINSSSRFRVSANTITYIGHLRMFTVGSRYDMKVFDRETDMREHLQAEYPKYAEGMRFEKRLAELRLWG